jgi:AraC-like DNA-binding protein
MSTVRSAIVPTVLAGWSNVLLDALRAHGIDPGELLTSCGFAHDAFANPNDRHPAPAVARLWRRAARAAGDPAFGLRVSKYATHTSCHALGFAVFASSTLRDAVDRMVRYHSLVNDGCSLTLEVGAETSALRLSTRPGYDEGADEQLDAGTSLLVRVSRALVGQKAFTLDNVQLSRAMPVDLAPYVRFFGAPVSFGRDNVVTFDTNLLALPVRTANPELARHNDEAARDYLARVSAGSIVHRVRAAIARRLGEELTPALIAKDLGMSLRSFQRTLANSGTSYEALLTDVRRELACAYLTERRLTITEIGFMLGYDHLSAFNRAFKRWLGCTPSDYQAGNARKQSVMPPSEPPSDAAAEPAS